jgi:hypothetical protein
MKYYIGKIEEINGGMEYSDKVLFSTKGSPEKYMDKLARDWRGCSKGDYDKEQGGYWSDCTIVRDDGYKEIPKEDYEVLRRYLAVL